MDTPDLKKKNLVSEMFCHLWIPLTNTATIILWLLVSEKDTLHMPLIGFMTGSRYLPSMIFSARNIEIDIYNTLDDSLKVLLYIFKDFLRLFLTFIRITFQKQVNGSNGKLNINFV